MKLSLISFTRQGNQVNQYLIKELSQKGYQCEGYIMDRFKSDDEGGGLIPLEITLKEWAREQFCRQQGIIFVGAVGIAVRLIAPFLVHKSEDPAVVVVDDGAQFAVALLSGHLGGANELTGLVGEILGATPVITTSTDVNNKFSIDLFAKKNDLMITDWKAAKEIAARFLENQEVGLFCDIPLTGKIPAGFFRDKSCGKNVRITYRYPGKSEPDSLYLIPKAFVLGIGCRKGTLVEDIDVFVRQLLNERQIVMAGIAAIASIDLKREEDGLLKFAKKYKIPAYFYSAEILQQVKGEFRDSDFVRQITGVGNVCERAALHHAALNNDNSCVVMGKQAGKGITVSLVQMEVQIVF